MIKDKPIADVTEEDLDERFRQGLWTTAGGNFQSLEFYAKAFKVIEKSPYSDMFDKLAKGMYTLHDYGCAEGDGTALLQAHFPVASIKGFDLSTQAVTRAKERWPTVAFFHGDITNPQEDANVIWTSHTLEHLPSPALTVSRLLQRCRWLIVVVPPIPEGDNSEAHTGAVPINVWINQLAVWPLHAEYFITERADTERKGHVLLEESMLFIFQGRRAW